MDTRRKVKLAEFQYGKSMDPLKLRWRVLFIGLIKHTVFKLEYYTKRVEYSTLGKKLKAEYSKRSMPLYQQNTLHQKEVTEWVWKMDLGLFKVICWALTHRANHFGRNWAFFVIKIRDLRYKLEQNGVPTSVFKKLNKLMPTECLVFGFKLFCIYMSMRYPSNSYSYKKDVFNTLKLHHVNTLPSRIVDHSWQQYARTNRQWVLPSFLLRRVCEWARDECVNPLCTLSVGTINYSPKVLEVATNYWDF